MTTTPRSELTESGLVIARATKDIADPNWDDIKYRDKLLQQALYVLEDDPNVDTHPLYSCEGVAERIREILG